MSYLIDFNNLKTAFSDKSNTDLNRAYLLFKSMNNPYISKILTKIVTVALKLHFPVLNIIKITVYKHFCGGETIQKCQKTIDKLWKSRIGTILDFSAEGKETTKDFNRVLQQTLFSIEKAANTDSIPFTVFKPTGLCKFSILEKINRNSPLTFEEEVERQEFELKVDSICKMAKNKNVSVFIDAEESWIQNTIDNVAEKMMEKYNKQKAIVFNTVQLYRKDRIEYIESLIAKAEEKYFIGLKLVRGAYHEQEISRAITNKYHIPVHTHKSKTDKDYNTAIKLCIQNIKRIAICAGTHNEKSINFLVTLMKDYNLNNDDNRIYFSQLLGMSDHISYNLSAENYNTSKYVPYGPVRDVMPYLIRRAEENTSISGQMGRELTNIIAERKRRKKN